MNRTACFLIMPIAIALLLFAASCGGAEKGALPALKTGDRWVTWFSAGETESTVTFEVTGEVVVDGANSYVVEGTAEPPYLGFISALTTAYDKTTFLPRAMESSGQLMGLPYKVVAEYTYELNGDPLFPLKVGNENTVLEKLTATTTIMGDTSTEIRTRAYTNKVEKLEEVTVPAGTFECFKIVEYHEDGTPSNTSWYSDEVRWSVQETDHESGEVVRLIRYALK